MRSDHEIEVLRQKLNAAGRQVKTAVSELDQSIFALVDAAEKYGYACGVRDATSEQ